MWHDIHPDAKSRFVTKGEFLSDKFFRGVGYLEQYSLIRYETAKRGPLRDDDCSWDYGKARCAWPEYCEYRLFSVSYI